MSEKGVSYEAWSRSMIGFIRERGLEMEFADWCGGWKCPISGTFRSSPRVEEVRRMREALVISRGFVVAALEVHPDMKGLDVNDHLVVREIDAALSLPDGEGDKQARSPSALSAPASTFNDSTTK